MFEPIIEPFHQHYAQEAHVVVTREMLNNHGMGPSGVAWDDLIADVRALRGSRLRVIPRGLL